VRQVLLHGSPSLGRVPSPADFSVAVILSHMDGDWAQESLRLRDLFVDSDFEVDVHAFSAEEYERSRTVPGSLAHSIALHAVPLHDPGAH